MKRVALALTFGICAVSARASAEPKGHASATRAKAAPPAGGSRPSEDDAVYRDLVAAADTDGDQQVKVAELELFVRRYVRQQVEVRFRRLDRNGDGRVTRGEVPKMAPDRFARFDADHDGSFTELELANVVERQALQRCNAVFARLDVDRDGELSVADVESSRPTRISKR